MKGGAMGFADLHLHTCFSDGLTSPAELVDNLASEKGLTHFAVTDHDTLSAIEPVFRFLNRHEDSTFRQTRRFIPGIELSLVHKETDNTVHLLGYFPKITAASMAEDLPRIDSVLGAFCRYRAEHRAAKDVDARIRRAFELNLDGIADRFDAPETAIRLLRDKAAQQSADRFTAAGKESDVIQYPIPGTYQIIVDSWEALFPSASREKAALYVLRPDPSKQKRLATLYRGAGMAAAEAGALAERNQGALLFFKQPSPIEEMDVFEGLGLLRDAGAVTILAHPAVDHVRVSYEEFDSRILHPLIERGLNGIEVFYPYDRAFRAEAVTRYRDIARKHGLLMSGGTDFHGDGRTGLSDIQLDVENARRIMRSGRTGEQ